MMQRAAVNTEQIDQVPSIVHDVLRTPGQSLDTGTRTFMETSFGHDFSHVRVHTDTQAEDSAHSVNALAYTVGSHVAFGQGQYRPDTPSGKQLLAHELTHVVQQGTPVPPANMLTVSNPHDASEQTAHRMASSIMAGNASPASSGPSHASSSTLYRQETPEATTAPSSTTSSPTPAPQGQAMSVTLDHFAFGDDKLPKDQAIELKALDALAQTIVATLSTHTDAFVTVIGHTDEVGTDKYNLDLGKRRAEATRDYLVQQKVPANRIKVHSFGKSLPVVKTGKANELNRRVEVLFDIPPTPANQPQTKTSTGGEANKDRVKVDLPPAKGDVDVKVQDKPGKKQETKPDIKPDDTKSSGKKEDKKPDKPKKESEEEKPHLGRQIGIGRQGPDKPFTYVQFTLEWSNKFALDIKNEKLPAWMRHHIDSVHILGEPGGTLQLHFLGDSVGAVDVQSLAKLVQLSITDDLDLSTVFGATYNDIFGKPKANKGAIVFGGEAELKLKKPFSIVVDVLGAYPFAPPDEPPTFGSRRVPMTLSIELRISK
ncbi:MAG TPA: DUF4157 domain-containing protein [Ktedonobacteraceae bacterium]|nr:DUF4157 domain-containing protein [Ktedonobacteraceae bacterium]